MEEIGTIVENKDTASSHSMKNYNGKWVSVFVYDNPTYRFVKLNNYYDNVNPIKVVAPGIKRNDKRVKHTLQLAVLPKGTVIDINGNLYTKINNDGVWECENKKYEYFKLKHFDTSDITILKWG